MSENIQFQEEKPLHHYRTEIPNCIFDAKLDTYEFTVYCYIKRVAGDSGECFKSYKKICEDLGISRDKLIRSLESLCEINKILKVPLLKKLTRSKEDGSKDTNKFLIVGIWMLNMERSKIISGSTPERLGVVREKDGGSTPKRHKEDPSEEDPFKKQQQEKQKVEEKETIPKAAAACQKEIITYLGPERRLMTITRSDVHRAFIGKGISFAMIEIAIDKFSKRKTVSNNPVRVLEYIIGDLLSRDHNPLPTQEILDKKNLKEQERLRELEEHRKKPKGKIIW